MKIEQASESTVSKVWSEAEPEVQRAATLEEAAQALVKTLQRRFDESVVIARAFVTVPFGQLPDVNQQFVRGLAESAGAGSALKDSTPVLSLVGTYGKEADWRDRRKSKGHVGIPLISSSFVGGIPMISRLLKEMGVPLDWVDSHDSELIVNTIGNKTGLFFVENAATATDAQGRKIIAAQDFVAGHGVSTVFGIGAAYSSGQMVVIVVFCRDTFPRAAGERFMALANPFTTQTAELVEPAKVFAA